MDGDQRKKLINFEPTITSGNLLTAIAMVAAAFLFFSAQSERLSQEEFERRIGDQKLQSQIDKTTVVLDRLMEDVKTLTQKDMSRDISE